MTWSWQSIARSGVAGLLAVGVFAGTRAGNAPPRQVMGWAPLHFAAATGSVSAVRLLLAVGANPDVRSLDNKTPLFLASRNGHPGLVRLLLDAGSDPGFKAGTVGFTPLHIAVENLHPEVVELLLERGAAVDVRNDWLQTPLTQGAWNTNGRDADMLEMLIAHGADVNVRDNRGYSPLHHAAEYGQEAAIRTLVAHGADLEAYTDGGVTPLYRAVRKGHPRAAHLLLDFGANPVGARGGTWTPLHEAADTGDAAMVALLLRYGGSPDARMSSGSTPMILAAEDFPEVVRVLAQAGADMEIANASGRTALARAAAAGNLEIAHLLLELGATVDGPDSALSPLYWAVRYDQVDMVRLLMAAGADPRRGSSSPLSTAEKEGKTEIVETILEELRRRGEG